MVDEPFLPNIDELLEHNARYAEDFHDQELGVPPKRHLAIVACMDSRMDIFQMLGLAHGEAHIIRNAGGVVTADVERSLSISQHELGTTEIVLLHHTGCGMQTTTDEAFAARLEQRTGARPQWAAQAFDDLDGDVRASIEKLRSSPFLGASTSIRGFVYDVGTGDLREVRP